MRHFKNVLVYAAEDGGDAAVHFATRLSVETHADITLADVVEKVPALARRLLPRRWDLPKVIRAQKQAHLARTAARVRRSSVDPKILLLSGSPVEALVREVARSQHDLLATDVSSLEGLECMRATAAGLVRACPCPVLLVRPFRGRGRKRVLVAVDVGPWRMKGADSLNRTLMEAALWFTQHTDGELHVLHVWSPYGERSMVRAGLTPAEEKSDRFPHLIPGAISLGYAESA